MRPRTLASSGLSALLGAAVIGTFAWAAGWGPLNPPAGPVAPTAKPLGEIEPRIAVNATNTPGDATSVFKITQPGSYYLAQQGGATPAGKHGILITASGVTLDLNGFKIWSVGEITSTLDGVNADPNLGLTNIVVRNGIVYDMHGDGVNLSGAVDCRVENVQASRNLAAGVRVGSRSLVTGCTASYNSGRGIAGGAACTLDRCVAYNNYTTAGLSIDYGVITACTSSLNSGSGIATGGSAAISGCSCTGNTGDGINTDVWCTITGCSAAGNILNGIHTAGGCTIVDCATAGNQRSGVLCADGCTISRCAAASNVDDGIAVTANCLVQNNTCNLNGAQNGTGAGIKATANANRIEGNTCSRADYGVFAAGTGNCIIKNTCSGNTTLNWYIVANNIYGPIIDRTSPASAGVLGSSAPASTLGSTDPNANFSY